MKKWQQVFGAGAVLLIAVLAVSVMNNYSEATPAAPQYIPPSGLKVVEGSGPLGCDFSGVDSPIITGVLSRVNEPGVRLQVPRAYLVGRGHIADGTLGSDGTVLMQMKADQFAPYPDNEQHLNQESARQQLLTVLIWQFGKLADIAQKRAEFNAAAEPGTSFREVPQANGLLKYDYVPRQNKEIYVAREAGRITDVVECRANTGSGLDVPSPNCEHMTSASGLDVSITYFKTRLNDWKTLKGRVSNFLTCMTTK